jgi:hypothetical protein
MDISSIVNSTSSTDASNDADKTALLSAIDSANLNRVRTVLREICIANPEAFKLASAKLLVSPEKLDAVNKTAESNGAGSKRKAQHRYETCVQCNSEYDVLDNQENACVWHEGTSSLFLYYSYLPCPFPSPFLAVYEGVNRSTGETEPDYDGDFWADHDEDCHGEIDTDDMRKDFPEGFIWSCCEKSGEEKGCRVSVHRPDVEGGKRRRR